MEFRPATLADLPAIVDLDRRVLARHDVIEAAVFASWLQVNPSVFQVLDVGGAVAGYVSVLPLRPASMRRFERGQVAERELTGADVCTEREARALRRLYFFSIARDPAQPRLGRPLVQHAWHCLTSRQAFPRVDTLVAAAATDAGRRLLVRLGFAPSAPALGRRDGHALYERGMPPGPAA